MTAEEKIIDDLKDRRGLRQEWEQIDHETCEEIKTKWASFICEAQAEAIAKTVKMAVEEVKGMFGVSEDTDTALKVILQDLEQLTPERVMGEK